MLLNNGRAFADNTAMKYDNEHPLSPEDPLYHEATALGMSLVAIRKACDKPNPSFYAIGSPEWLAATDDFARDILRVLGVDIGPSEAFEDA
ncbi:hypothetical protein BGLT_05254 [Caballeronia glathei]|nr:hypothetical protein B0G84_6989 [Paraburkholderia sp. BL8N3]CDY76181.1 hypothetical protein BGLT_05254 [Caballeronia glathei]